MNLKNKCFYCNAELKLHLRDVYDTRFGFNSSFDIFLCPFCYCAYTYPIPDKETLKILYESYYNFEADKPRPYIKIRSLFFSSILYRLWSLIDGDVSFYLKCGKGNLLDLGCNEGRGLQIFTKNGFTTDGLELNEIAASKAKAAGFTVSTTPLEHYRTKKAYDVVVLSNVIEHSLNPEKMLDMTSRLLKKDGRVWISCPNLHSWQCSLFKKYWINWHVPFHISHFSKNTLSKLLQKAGFQIVEEKQISPSLWMAQSIIACLFAKPGHATIQMRQSFLVASLTLIIRCLFFPMLWVGNLSERGDCLWVVAKKVY